MEIKGRKKDSASMWGKIKAKYSKLITFGALTVAVVMLLAVMTLSHNAQNSSPTGAIVATGTVNGTTQETTVDTTQGQEAGTQEPIKEPETQPKPEPTKPKLRVTGLPYYLGGSMFGGGGGGVS